MKKILLIATLLFSVHNYAMNVSSDGTQDPTSFGMLETFKMAAIPVIFVVAYANQVYINRLKTDNHMLQQKKELLKQHNSHLSGELTKLNQRYQATLQTQDYAARSCKLLKDVNKVQEEQILGLQRELQEMRDRQFAVSLETSDDTFAYSTTTQTRASTPVGPRTQSQSILVGTSPLDGLSFQERWDWWDKID